MPARKWVRGLYTKIAQVVADAFGVPATQVRNNATRTDKVPNGSPTAASSGTDMNGMAALQACNNIKQGLLAFAEGSLGWTETLTFQDSTVRSGTNVMPFTAFIKAAYMARTPLSATGFYATPEIHFDKDNGFGKPFYYYAFGAAATEVAVDTRTGEYRILRVDILHDAGRSLNPAVDRGQIEGGYVQGLGWLTSEELLWDDRGRVMSNSPANYKIPTAHDVPAQVKVQFFERDNAQPLSIAPKPWANRR